MRTHLLDTPILCEILLRRASTTAAVRELILASKAATSIVVVDEALERVIGMDDDVLRRDRVIQFQDIVYPFAIDFAIVERYGALRRALRPPHGPGLIGDIDTPIAATAIEHRTARVTMDHNFERAPGLDPLSIPHP